MAYAAGEVFVQAIQAAAKNGGVTRDNVLKQLNTQEFHTLIGRLPFRQEWNAKRDSHRDLRSQERQVADPLPDRSDRDQAREGAITKSRAMRIGMPTASSPGACRSVGRSRPSLVRIGRHVA